MSDTDAVMKAIADVGYQFLQNLNEDDLEGHLKYLADRILWHQVVDAQYGLDFEGKQNWTEWMLVLELRHDRFNSVWKGCFSLSKREEPGFLVFLQPVVEIERTGTTSILAALDEMRETFWIAVKSSDVPSHVKTWARKCLFPALSPVEVE